MRLCGARGAVDLPNTAALRAKRRRCSCRCSPPLSCTPHTRTHAPHSRVLHPCRTMKRYGQSLNSNACSPLSCPPSVCFILVLHPCPLSVSSIRVLYSCPLSVCFIRVLFPCPPSVSSIHPTMSSILASAMRTAAFGRWQRAAHERRDHDMVSYFHTRSPPRTGPTNGATAWALVGVWLLTLGMCVLGTSSLKVPPPRQPPPRAVGCARRVARGGGRRLSMAGMAGASRDGATSHTRRRVHGVETAPTRQDTAYAHASPTWPPLPLPRVACSCPPTACGAAVCAAEGSRGNC